MQVFRVSFIVSCFSLLLCSTASAQDWTFEIEPYALGANIEGDASIGRVSGAPVDVDFDAILENLDMAAMIHFEAHHQNGWGAIVDYGFMDLGAEISTSRGGVVDASVRQGILEGLLVYRSELGDSTLDMSFGIRWWDNDIDISVDPALLPGSSSTSIEADWIDLVVGARWINPISTRWKFQLKGDFGGLGVESDFTYSLSTGFLFQMSENWTLDLQYKGTWVDFEEGSSGSENHFAYDTVTHGPLVGFSYKF